MKEIDNQLKKILQRALEAAEKTGEFIVDQAPDLLREFYLWHTVSAIFWIVVYFGIWAAVFYALKRMEAQEAFDEDDIFVIRILKGLSFSILAGALVNIYNLVFILVAPNLYLIKYLTSL